MTTPPTPPTKPSRHAKLTRRNNLIKILIMLIERPHKDWEIMEALCVRRQTLSSYIMELRKLGAVIRCKYAWSRGPRVYFLDRDHVYVVKKGKDGLV